eukprot:Rhum_TRINITY_DN24846_c0_g2::Rhum_TRINITY_DN24846_c0_g2_i1::g.180174::m.180174/K08592/SENP1; sentrin-specific protease 1
MAAAAHIWGLEKGLKAREDAALASVMPRVHTADVSDAWAPLAQASWAEDTTAAAAVVGDKQAGAVAGVVADADADADVDMEDVTVEAALPAGAEESSVYQKMLACRRALLSSDAGTTSAVASAPGQPSLLQSVLKLMVRRMVESRLPSVAEVLEHSSYEQAHALVCAQPLSARLRAQQLLSSDEATVREIWESQREAASQGQGWWDSDALQEVDGVKLTRRDLSTLADRTWLNDAAINAYLTLVCRRSKEVPQYPDTHALSSHWFTRLVGPYADKYDYSGVRRWTRSVNVFAQDRVLVPVNWGASHWTLGVIYFKAKTIVFYDSLGSRSAGEFVCKTLSKWIDDERIDKKNW